MTKPLVLPPRLSAGDTVALISPASPPGNRSTVLVGERRLERFGFNVVTGPHVLGSYGYLAGTDRDRLADLEWAFRDGRVKGIFCARGGYGVSRLLPSFDPEVARRYPKPLVGFSDITVLHLALQKAGVVSFWGPMPCTSLWSPFSARGLERALLSTTPAGLLPFSRTRRPATLRRGVAEGPITGGTLTLLAASLGTPYEVETRDRIVFLEDVDEEPYRVDRMLTQLIAAGALADAAGIAIGIFTGTTVKHSPGRRSLTMSQVFADHLLPLKLPILANVAVGHVADQVTLPYGVTARLDANARTLELLGAGVSEPRSAQPRGRVSAAPRRASSRR
jgi:muramoyltetrapeptide carboxypeptidase